MRLTKENIGETVKTPSDRAVAEGLLIMHPSAAEDRCVCSSRLLTSASEEATNEGSRSSKRQTLLERRLFLDSISVKCFKDVDVLESTHRARENAAQTVTFERF